MTVSESSGEFNSRALDREFRILHMYYDLMSLYGDWANPVVLARELSARGAAAVVDKRSVGDEMDISSYHFIYIGSGTEKSQLACMRDLLRFKDIFIDQINAGIPVLASGNSHELFGRVVTDRNAKSHKMLDLLGFETVQSNTRVTGDCMCTATFLDDKLIGFINRAGGKQEGDIERPFFIEPGEGANYAACHEGIRYKNLLGTYMTGPVLVRNPPLLRYFADVIMGGMGSLFNNSGKSDEGFDRVSIDDPFFEYQERAYIAALTAL